MRGEGGRREGHERKSVKEFHGSTKCLVFWRLWLTGEKRGFAIFKAWTCQFSNLSLTE